MTGEVQSANRAKEARALKSEKALRGLLRKQDWANSVVALPSDILEWDSDDDKRKNNNVAVAFGKYSEESWKTVVDSISLHDLCFTARSWRQD